MHFALLYNLLAPCAASSSHVRVLLYRHCRRLIPSQSACILECRGFRTPVRFLLFSPLGRFALFVLVTIIAVVKENYIFLSHPNRNIGEIFKWGKINLSLVTSWHFLHFGGIPDVAMGQEAKGNFPSGLKYSQVILSLTLSKMEK